METLGTKLRSEREKQKLTLEKVSELTKIRINIIKALEDGNYSVVPPVYAKSFIKTYASLLNIPKSDIEDELDELFRSKLPEPIQYKQPELKSHRGKKSKINFLNLKFIMDNKTRIVNYLIYFVITFAFLLVIYFLFFDGVDIPKIVEGGNNEQNENDTVVIKPDNKGLFSFYEGPDSLILEAFANDSAWIKINIDGQISDQAYMLPNESKRWSASEFFIITLGNAGVVEFMRNGEKLPALGAIGTVVRNIKITAKEVINSSNPWDTDSASIARRRYRQKTKKPDAAKILQPAIIEENPLKNLIISDDKSPSSINKKKEDLKLIQLPKIEEEKNPPKPE
jgi:transcriptional regulator with XRE-family HTH domain